MIRGVLALTGGNWHRNLTNTVSRFSGGSNGPQRGSGRGNSRGGSWGGRGGPRSRDQSNVTYASSTSAPVSSSSPQPQTTNTRVGGRGHHNHTAHNSRQSSQMGHGAHLPDPSACSRLVDIGANLSHRDFRGDLSALLARAKAHKVYPILVTGTSLRASDEAYALCQANPGFLYSTAGVHPHDAKSCNDQTIPKLRTLAQYPEVVAIGECGLDFDRNFSEPAVQERWFAEQLKLAAEVKKPVFLHERKAHHKFVEILNLHREILDLSTCVVHCFTGSSDELKTYLEMGMYIGITGWVTNRDKGKELRDAVSLIPLDRIMIETDSPFLAPRNAKSETGERVRIQRNEPELLQLVLQELALLMGVSETELAAASTANAHRFFNIPLPESNDKA